MTFTSHLSIPSYLSLICAPYQVNTDSAGHLTKHCQVSTDTAAHLTEPEMKWLLVFLDHKAIFTEHGGLLFISSAEWKAKVSLSDQILSVVSGAPSLSMSLL